MRTVITFVACITLGFAALLLLAGSIGPVELAALVLITGAAVILAAILDVRAAQRRRLTHSNTSVRGAWLTPGE